MRGIARSRNGHIDEEQGPVVWSKSAERDANRSVASTGSVRDISRSEPRVRENGFKDSSLINWPSKIPAIPCI